MIGEVDLVFEDGNEFTVSPGTTVREVIKMLRIFFI